MTGSLMPLVIKVNVLSLAVVDSNGVNLLENCTEVHIKRISTLLEY